MVYVPLGATKIVPVQVTLKPGGGALDQASSMLSVPAWTAR